MVERVVFGPNGPYDYKDTSTHGEFDTIFALFLRDRSLVIQEEQKQESLNGGYFYKNTTSTFYKVYTNRHGEKYLRSFRKDLKGRIRMVTSESMVGDQFLYSGGYSRICPEMGTVIEEHLSKMLGWEFKRTRVQKDTFQPDGSFNRLSPEWLLFPFLRSADNYAFIDKLVKANAVSYNNRVPSFDSRDLFFKLDVSGPRGLFKALRECETQDELLSQLVYKSAIQGEADLDLLKADPSLLKIVSSMDLRMSVTEAKAAGYFHIFSKCHETMNTPELLAFKFLLANLPKEQVEDVCDLLVELDMRRRDWLATRKVKFNSYHQGFGGRKDCFGNGSTMEAAFRTIPLKDRRKFAVAFWEEFKAECEAASMTMAEGEAYVKVADAHMRAFSTIQNHSGITERCAGKVKSLFGVDLYELGDELGLYSVSFGIGNVEAFGVSTSRYQKKETLFSLILKDADFAPVWGEMFRVDASTHLLRHLDSEVEAKGNLVFASVFERVVMRVAGMIDAGLTAVGQELNPENRFMYLKAHVYDRKYKTNWKYFKLGVPSDDLYLFKKAKIRSKKDIAFWLEARDSLPKETYRELLHDAAGIKPVGTFVTAF